MNLVGGATCGHHRSIAFPFFGYLNDSDKRWKLQLLLWRNWGWLTGVGSRDARQALLFCFLKYSTLKDISTEEYWIEIFSHSEIIAFRRLKDDAVIQQKNNFLNTKTCNGNEIRSSKEINLMGWSCLEDRKY